MKLSSLPARIAAIFAASAPPSAINTIPLTAAGTTQPGQASFDVGFPSVTMQPSASGGINPYGQDFNGIVNAITAIQQWQSAGGSFTYDAGFSATVGGYPAGAVLLRTDGMGFWLCLTDNNTSNPDSASATGWAPIDSYGIAPVTGLTNGTVTLTPVQYGLPIITLAGALTGNVQLIFPATKNQWLVVNNTTGNFSVTAKTAAGAGVVIAQGLASNVYGDGTNIIQPALQIPAASNSAQPVQFGQVAGVVGTSRNAKMYVPSASASATFTADEIILESALGGLRYCLSSVSDTFNLTTDMDTGSAPASGFVALYKLYNPSTGASLRRIVNATAAVLPEIYSGAAVPQGFTASALVGVVPTNAAGQFAPFNISGRTVSIPRRQSISTAVVSAGYSSVTIADIPKNAKWIGGFLGVSNNTANASFGFWVGSDANGSGETWCSGILPQPGVGSTTAFGCTVVSPQTLFYTSTSSGGTVSQNIFTSSYQF